jgi:site-specific recombinase XerD
MVSQKYINEFEKYLISNNSSKTTIKSYLRTIKQFLSIIKRKPRDITKKDIERYKLYAIEVKKYDSNTLTPKYAAISRYMEYLNKDYKLKPPTKRIKNKIPLTIEEIKKLFHVSIENPRDHALIKVLYYGQLRRSELIALNLDDIDFQRQKIRINKGKGNQYCEINIHPDALKAIANYIRIRETPVIDHEHALFLSKNRIRIGRTDLSNTIKKYAEKANINKRVYPHLFRISSITHMAEKGLNLEQIRMQSRHKRYDTLQSYVQMSDQHVKKAYLKGLSLDTNQDIPRTEVTRNQKTYNNLDNSDIYLKLAQQLANGTITQEVYLQAIRSLKTSDQTEETFGYQ